MSAVETEHHGPESDRAHAGTASIPGNLNAGGAPSLLADSPSGSHTVQFYEDDSFLVASIVDFVTAGLTTGQPIVVIATEPHRDAVVQHLASDGFDVDAAVERGLLTLLDARATLLDCMADGIPDDRRFRATIAPVIDRATLASKHTVVRLYGEMVDLLWKDGDTRAALRVEELWNDLGLHYAFSLLCAYSMGNFYKSADADRFQDICHQHTHVIPAESYTRASVKARLAEISRLQQRAQALEAEIRQREELERRLRDLLAANRRTESVLRHRERELSAALKEYDALLDRERGARADAERARARADEANSVKSEFLASMSHELRTPLNAIAGYVQLVELGIHGPINDDQRKALGRVQRSQQHLLSLINDVLNFAKLEAGKIEYRLENVSLAEAIADVACMVEPQLAAKGIDYIVRATPEFVRADREKLQQILLNLISNAVKFTSRGGSVTLETGVHVGAVPEVVLLRVADTGCGISPDKHDVIFDPFVQVAARIVSTNEGTGLGLAISRDLARGMAGNLCVESKEGEGATFTLVLPAGIAA